MLSPASKSIRWRCILIFIAHDLIIIRLNEVLPTIQTGRYPLIGVAGVNCARDLDCTAGTSGLILCIKRQRTAVKADGHVAVEVDCAAIRRDFAVAHLTLVAKVRTDRAGLNRRAAARRERTAIRLDISIDEDGTEAIAIRIRMEVDIQRTRSRRDFLVDRDVTLCFERQGRISTARLVDGRIHCDGCDLIGIRCLYRNSRAVIQQTINRVAVDPCGHIAAGRAGCIIAAVIAAIRITIRDRTTATRLRIRDNDLKRVEQPLTCFAGLACCVDVDVIADLEIVAGGLDEAAVYCADCMERRSVLDVGLCADSLDRACTLPGLHAGYIKRAVQLDNAVIAAVQKDLTLLVLTQGLCFHRARVVDDRAHDIAGTPCRHDEIAAICLEHTTVECLCLGKCTVNGEVDFPCRISGQAEVTRCCKSRRTLGVRDRAAVLDFCRMQHDEATLCANRTGVDDLSRRILGNRHRDAVCIRKVRHIAVADPRRRSDKRTNVNTGVLAEQHAVGVDDIDMSVARKRTIDDGCSIADHAVQCYRVFVRLTEGHALIVRNVKARPVDCQAFGILVDRHVLVLSRDLALTGTDDFTLRHRIRNTADRHRHHRSGNRRCLALPSLSSSHRSFHFGSPLFVFNA